jgi:peptidoglycan/LPS O-acetylase OafA/YrhL
MTRFVELQGLRGLLALWVFVSHLVLFGWKPVGELRSPFNLLCDGSHAVTLFIILSGFVITHLVQERRETYGRYLWRRWCRLYPVFAVSVLAAFFCVRLGWMPADFSPGTAWQHLLLHMSLMHGAVPNLWLSNAPGSLLPPAWSVSLEWQFYLAAPFLLAWARRSPRAALGLSLVVFGAHRLVPPLLGSQYDYAGFLPLKLGYFWLGSASWFFVSAWRANLSWAETMASYRFIIVFGLAALAVSFSHFFAIFLWLGVVMLLLPDGKVSPDPLIRIGRYVLMSPAALWLGDISYSVYLIHEIVMCLVQVGFGTSLGAAAPHRLITLSALSIPITLALCTVIHHLIEKPGIRLGHLGTAR